MDFPGEVLEGISGQKCCCKHFWRLAISRSSTGASLSPPHLGCRCSWNRQIHRSWNRWSGCFTNILLQILALCSHTENQLDIRTSKCGIPPPHPTPSWWSFRVGDIFSKYTLFFIPNILYIKQWITLPLTRLSSTDLYCSYHTHKSTGGG